MGSDSRKLKSYFKKSNNFFLIFFGGAFQKKDVKEKQNNFNLNLKFQMIKKQIDFFQLFQAKNIKSN